MEQSEQPPAPMICCSCGGVRRQLTDSSAKYDLEAQHKETQTEVLAETVSPTTVQSETVEQSETSEESPREVMLALSPAEQRMSETEAVQFRRALLPESWTNRNVNLSAFQPSTTNSVVAALQHSQFLLNAGLAPIRQEQQPVPASNQLLNPFPPVIAPLAQNQQQILRPSPLQPTAFPDINAIELLQANHARFLQGIIATHLQQPRSNLPQDVVRNNYRNI